MGIICNQCGYENPDGSTVCEICGEELAPVSAAAQPQQFAATQTTAAQPQAEASGAGTGEFFVMCPESQTKTILPNGNVTKFFCQGCKKEHDIDGILWMIERKQVTAPNTTTGQQGDLQPDPRPQPKENNLWLEEVNTHFRIDIDKEGGMLGRYGKYGSAFFQSRGLLMVSGEHCLITNEFGNWVIRHVSRTNQTMYNNMILGANEPNLLEDGKVLTLANAVSFTVRIG